MSNPRRSVFAAALLLAAPCAAQAATVVNPSFELPGLGAGQFVYGIAAPGWTFGNSNGITWVPSSWDFVTPIDGTHVAFMQSAASISQTILDLSPGATYQVTFAASHRPGYVLNPLTVTFDSTQIFAVTPTSDFWLDFTTASFVASAMTGVLTFTSAGGLGDTGSGIDLVRLTQVTELSEPATLALLGGALGALAMIRRRKPR